MNYFTNDSSEFFKELGHFACDSFATGEIYMNSMLESLLC
jgi:hypothetical protein